MAYQPKSYKKFVATAATATLVATAVVPAAFANEAETAAFTDVAPQYAQAVEYVVSNNIAKGFSDTQFGITSEIKRGDAAIMVAQAAGLMNEKAPVAGFTDVPKRGQLAINSLKAAGVVNGKSDTKFDFESKITRGEAALMLARAYELTGNGSELPFTDAAGSRYEDAVAALVAAEVTNGISDTQFGVTKNIKRGDFAVFLYRLSDVKETPEPSLPEVATVSAINATQVEVKFKTEVQEASAEATANYTINNVNPSTAVLGSDKKTVTLTFANASDVEVTNGVVVVNPIKTAANTSISTAKFAQVYTFEDKVNPLISTVESKTNGTIANSVTVKATEPIDSTLAKVNGTYVNANFNGTDTATITGLSLEAGKSHTVELVNLTDKGGNVTVSTTASFNVSVDTVAPTATLSAEGDKQILVTFSKSMKVDTVKAALANGAVKDETLSTVSTGAVTVVEDSNDTQFLIPVTSKLFDNKDSRTLTVVLPTTLEDKLGNKATARTQSVILTKDTVKPVATGYNVIEDADGKVTDIEVLFSEGLAANIDPSEPTIVNENGVAVLASSFLGGLTADPIKAGDKKVTYSVVTPGEVNGKFAFSFGANLVTDQSEVGNKSDAFNYTVDFGTGATTFTLPKGSATASANTIKVEFGRAVKGGAVANSATDLANYTLAGKPLPAGTTIVLDAPQDTATITLPAESIAKDDKAAVFTIANVQSLSGATLTTYTGTVGVTDNVRPVLNSAALTTDNQVIIGFSETLVASSLVATDLNVSINDKDVTLTGTANLVPTPGTGSDVGKYLINIGALVKQGTAAVPEVPGNDGVDGLPGTADDVAPIPAKPATATYIDVDNNGSYDSAKDIKIADGPVADFKFSTSSAVTSIDISTLETGTSTAKDASNNPLKNDVEVSAK